MDHHIARRVIGLLTLAASDIPMSDALMEGLLGDVLGAHITVPEPHTVQEVADALAVELRVNVRELLLAFCVAFLSLAEINDAGVTAMSSAELLQRVALTYENDGSG